MRDVDEALPLILSGTALLLVLAGVGFTLHRTRVRRGPAAVSERIGQPPRDAGESEPFSAIA